jgi:hypothetical protein
MRITRIGCGIALCTAMICQRPAIAKSPETQPASIVAWNVRRGPDKGFASGLWLHNESGVEMTLVLDMPQQEILSIDGSKAAITCADDKGTDLLVKNPKSLGRPGLEEAGLAADGHSAKLVLRTYFSPAESATQISLKGTIGVSCGINLKKIRQQNVSLSIGSKFQLGSIEFEVRAPQSRARDVNNVGVEFSSHSVLRAIKTLRFLDASGKEIKSESTGSGMNSDGHTRTEFRDYAVFGQASTVTIEADLFTDSQTIQVPIDLKLGVGVKNGGSSAAKQDSNPTK